MSCASQRRLLLLRRGQYAGAMARPLCDATFLPGSFPSAWAKASLPTGMIGSTGDGKKSVQPGYFASCQAL